MMRSTTCALQLILTQRKTASPSGFTSSSPHTGHFVGKTIFFSFPFLNSIKGFTMYGITSPARSTKTVSPILTSFSFTTSGLKSEMEVTVTPPIGTGSILATGVIAPVRPT